MLGAINKLLSESVEFRAQSQQQCTFALYNTIVTSEQHLRHWKWTTHQISVVTVARNVRRCNQPKTNNPPTCRTASALVVIGVLDCANSISGFNLWAALAEHHFRLLQLVDNLL